MPNISKKAISDRIGYIADWDATSRFRRCVMLNDAGIWELQAPIDTRGQRLAAPTDADIYAYYILPAKLLLLDDSDYTYTSETADYIYTSETGQFLEIDRLGEVDPDDTQLCRISLTGREIGTLTQDPEDETWTATPIRENISQEKERPTARGFAHELYAADYLKERSECLYDSLTPTNHD